MVRLTVLLALLGCKKPSAEEELVRQWDAFAVAMCACKDADCVQRVDRELIIWLRDLARHDPGDLGTPADPLKQKYHQCRDTLMPVVLPDAN